MAHIMYGLVTLKQFTFKHSIEDNKCMKGNGIFNTSRIESKNKDRPL